MLILLIATLVIFWGAHLWLNTHIIRAVQARQHEMLPKQIAQAQRMFKRQWYRAHPVWRWTRRLAIGINGVALVALISQMLNRASWVVLPIVQWPLAIWAVVGFIVAGIGLAVITWHYDQMLLATAQTDLYTPPRLLVRANWWLLMVCQCVLVGTAGVTMQAPSQTPIKAPVKNVARTIDPTITAAKQAVAGQQKIATTAQATFWQLHIDRANALSYRAVEALLGQPSRILARVKSGELVSGVVTWQHFADTDQRLTLVFQNGRVVAKLCDQITVLRDPKPSVFEVDFALTSTDNKELATRFGGYNWVAGTRDIVWAQFFSDQYIPVDNLNFTFGYTGLTGKKAHAASFTFNMAIQSADDIYSDQPTAKHKGEVALMRDWYRQAAEALTQQLRQGNVNRTQVKQGRQALAALKSED